MQKANKAIIAKTIVIKKTKSINEFVNREKALFIKTNDKKRIHLETISTRLINILWSRKQAVGSVYWIIKDFRKYLEKLRAEQNSVCITNKHNTSQLCVFCFEPLCHPRNSTAKLMKGALLCINPACLLLVVSLYQNYFF
ncbi:MAG: hypothetical protein EXX96DRAFT_542037 [Benjaminiella poitrasii]|nr:MAG: hypothetical protein EXX96DRAFT_542037 [Benjaminiella poitrasii]